MRERFAAEFPNAYFLDEADIAGLSSWLRIHAWIDADTTVHHLESAGEGNMNLTLRAEVGGRTIILKQCRPWVEKYPMIAAPADRALVEARFYELTALQPLLTSRMARLLFSDAESRMLCIEDLGEASDMSDLYRADFIYGEGEIEDLLDWLGKLHRLPVTAEPLLLNRGMRALNHAHIFRIPLDPDNGLDLDGIRPGLAELAARAQADTAFVEHVHTLGDVYLGDGTVLQHGDFYPGSFLRTDDGVRIIDPEFCFLGRPEFDMGVFVAHFLLSCHSPGEVDGLFATYDAPAGFDRRLAEKFAGVEIMRRLIGVAQLPIDCDDDKLVELMGISRQWVMGC